MTDIDWQPNRGTLRQFAVIWLVGFGVVGLIVAWRLGCLVGSGRWTAPLVSWVLASTVGFVGLAIPRAAKPIYVAWMALTLPISWCVSHVILAVVYFGLFTPVALVFRSTGRDTLRRRFEEGADTYWVERGPPAPVERYFRQF